MPINLAAPLASADPEIAAQIRNEVVRQHEGLEDQRDASARGIR
ncbi:MAG TPA: hypothetical protein VF221_18340 [Chloroflexota bacterium]